MAVGPIPGVRGISFPRHSKAEDGAVPAPPAIDTSGRAADNTYSANADTPDQGVEGAAIDGDSEAGSEPEADAPANGLRTQVDVVV